MPEFSGQRRVLEEVTADTGSTNASLWFDRYFNARLDTEAKRTLMEQTAKLGIPEEYRTFYDRYRAAIDEQDGVQWAIADVQGRLIVGLGDKGVAETGITLHHTYGVPYIPGSALKGLASAYAHLRLDGAEWRKGGIDHTILFGTTDTSGYITFFDALYIPGSAEQNRPLARDVVTGHHPEYYVGNEPKPPADWDSPNPVPFLTATGRYLIAVAGPERWAQTALMILGMALRDLGIGAKTAAGYGRMRLLDTYGRPILLPDEVGNADIASGGAPAEPPQVMSFRKEIAQAQKQTLANLVPRLEQLAIDPTYKRMLAEVLIARVRELKMNTEGKKWYEQLLRLREGNTGDSNG
ncbi:type III-B CRISPR module RAMP protein Cmr6 [Chloroflexus sp.]|uniref:type III-B CRISPR module RAMP protein Cmr6 n=1 Tax=Chloroflexus sp. TaxID=1904827 RepID=UPI0026205944|nr:type III-B CRISPR module RAMP protein Cmr6 [uncultured Chloroflexus sp.]